MSFWASPDRNRGEEYGGTFPASLLAYALESGEGDDGRLLWDRKGLVVECFRWGAVKELDLKENVDSCLSPGCPQVTQGADSVALDTGRSSWYSAPHLEQ